MVGACNRICMKMQYDNENETKLGPTEGDHLKYRGRGTFQIRSGDFSPPGPRLVADPGRVRAPGRVFGTFALAEPGRHETNRFHAPTPVAYRAAAATNLSTAALNPSRGTGPNDLVNHEYINARKQQITCSINLEPALNSAKTQLPGELTNSRTPPTGVLGGSGSRQQEVKDEWRARAAESITK
jgi:hypothetical protein